MAKLRIIWKESETVKNAFILHMAQYGSTYPSSGESDTFVSSYIYLKKIGPVSQIRGRGLLVYT